MIVYKDESYAIMGVCYAVYQDKGCGFLEAVYQECLEIELAFLGIPFTSQQPLHLSYRGKLLKQHYIADIICYGKIILELKAVSRLADEHKAQLLNYLNATGYELGILLNFGHHPNLEYQRVANTRGKSTL